MQCNGWFSFNICAFDGFDTCTILPSHDRHQTLPKRGRVTVRAGHIVYYYVRMKPLLQSTQTRPPPIHIISCTISPAFTGFWRDEAEKRPECHGVRVTFPSSWQKSCRIQKVGNNCIIARRSMGFCTPISIIKDEGAIVCNRNDNKRRKDIMT